MANRFWVGGTAAWDGTAGTKWAATSGGAGGASVPTSADDVLFDAASTGTSTITGVRSCRSLTTTGFAGTLSWGDLAANNLLIGDASGGALTIGAGTTTAGFLNAVTSSLQLVATSDNGGAGWPITTNGKSLPATTFGGSSSQGVGGKWTLQDAITVAIQGVGQLTLTVGHLDLNSKAVSAWIMSIAGTGTRTLTMGASVVTCSSTATGWTAATTTGLTFNAGTSRIVLTGSATIFASGALTYYDLDLTGSGAQAINIGAGLSVTFHNLKRVGTALRGDALRVMAGAGITVTGLLTLTGNSITNRLWVWGADSSTQGGVAVSITAATIALTNVDFRDIAAAGAATPWTGTSLGDGLGNSNITFAAGVSRYWIGGTGNYEDPLHWSASNGGAGSASVPLPQDDVFFTSLSGVGTINARMPRMGRNFDMTGSSVTIDTSGATGSADHYVFGNLTMKGWQGGNNLGLGGRGSHTLQTNGASVTQSVRVEGGTYTLLDNMLITANGLTIIYGTFDANDFNVTTPIFSVPATAPTGGQIRSLDMGNGTWTLTATANVWVISAPFTVAAGTSTILVSDTTSVSTKVISNSTPLVYYDVRFSGSGVLRLLSSTTWHNITIDTPTRLTPRTLATSGTQTITGDLIANGAPGYAIQIQTITFGSVGALSRASGTNTVTYCVIRDMSVTGGARWVAQASIDARNASGWIFERLPVTGRLALDAPRDWADGRLPATPSVGLYCPGGASFSSASAPDAANLDIVGDITLDACWQPANWAIGSGFEQALVAKYNATSNQRSYLLYDAGSVGTIAFAHSADGATIITEVCTVTLASIGFRTYMERWIRVSYQADNGAGGRTTKFYWSIDGINWTQIGATIVGAAPSALFSGSALLEIGAYGGGASSRASGMALRARVFNSYLQAAAGTPVFDVDFTGQDIGARSIVAATGQVVTLQSSARFVGRRTVAMPDRPFLLAAA